MDNNILKLKIYFLLYDYFSEFSKILTYEYATKGYYFIEYDMCS